MQSADAKWKFYNLPLWNVRKKKLLYISLDYKKNVFRAHKETFYIPSSVTILLIMVSNLIYRYLWRMWVIQKETS